MEQRFWDHVVIPEFPDACWGWNSYYTADGYATVFDDATHKTCRGHRASYTIHFGKIPKGMHVLHKCDNPICTNPKHLFLGTHRDNMKDRDRKKRTRVGRGEKVHTAKLTEEDVCTIRQDTAHYNDVAKRYGIGKLAVFRIRSRASWMHCQLHTWWWTDKQREWLATLPTL